MLRKKRPHFFTIEDEKFKSNKLGYLTGGELLLKYTPVLLEMKKNLDSVTEPGADIKKSIDVNLGALLKDIPLNTIRNICSDLFENTYSGTVTFDDETQDEKTVWTLLDPEDFEGFEEKYKVVIEVFKLNFPSFFVKGDDTPKEPASEPQKKQGKDQKKVSKKKPGIVQL